MCVIPYTTEVPLTYLVPMRTTILFALIALPIMLVLDLTWTGVVAYHFYLTELGPLYAPSLVLPAIVLFYVIYILGLSYFVIVPAVKKKSLSSAVMNAAFFALVAYGTYDLTSLGITTGWPVILTVVDMSWGIFCAVVTTSLTYVIVMKVFKVKR
jgi:uncharacterized membrane protein